VSFFGKEKYDLSEIIADEAFIRISGKASKGETDEFLQE